MFGRVQAKRGEGNGLHRIVGRIAPMGYAAILFRALPALSPHPGGARERGVRGEVGDA